MLAELRAFLNARSLTLIVEGGSVDETPFLPDFARQTGVGDALHKFCSHQRFSTKSDHGRDQEVSPARKRFHTSRTAQVLIDV